MEDPELQGREVCGEDATAVNGLCACRNDKDDYFLDGDRAANRCQDDSNDEISSEKESVNSSDGDSATDRRGTGSSDKIPSEEEAAVFKWKGDVTEFRVCSQYS